MNEEVWYFNLEKVPTIIVLSENDMNDEDLNDTLLHENPESRRCVFQAFTSLHMCTLMSVVYMR